MSHRNPKIRVLSFPNPDIREYHTNVPISRGHVFSIHMPFDSEGDYESDELKKLGDVGRAILESISEIIGITEVSFDTYDLRVEKGIVFEWSEIEEHVINAIDKEIRSLDSSIKTIVEFRDAYSSSDSYREPELLEEIG